jgi:hypothetical protein
VGRGAEGGEILHNEAGAGKETPVFVRVARFTVVWHKVARNWDLGWNMTVMWQFWFSLLTTYVELWRRESANPALPIGLESLYIRLRQGNIIVQTLWMLQKIPCEKYDQLVKKFPTCTEPEDTSPFIMSGTGYALTSLKFSSHIYIPFLKVIFWYIIINIYASQAVHFIYVFWLNFVILTSSVDLYVLQTQLPLTTSPSIPMMERSSYEPNITQFSHSIRGRRQTESNFQGQRSFAFHTAHDFFVSSSPPLELIWLV